MVDFLSLVLRRTFLLPLIVLALLAPRVMAQADVQGQWGTASYQLPINPVHVALLHNGKVLIVTGSGNCPPTTPGCPSGPPYGPANNSGAALLDPVTTAVTQFTVAWDMFCNGMVVLPDGRAFINGGTTEYLPAFEGSAKSAVFDPATNTFTDVQNMAHGRWYPTVTTLGDGRVLAFGGVDENGATNTTEEFYTVGVGWSAFNAGWSPPLYPRMTLLPNGKVFYSGPDIVTWLFDPATHTWATSAHRLESNYRIYGSSVLLPLSPSDGYDPKVMVFGGGWTPSKTTEIIDMGVSNPAWAFGPSMSQNRVSLNAVLLPNQKVLVLGGSSVAEDATTSSLNADLYDPASNTMSSAGANSFPRLYHSNGLLLPDATVWVAGSNPDYNVWEPRVEIYKPAYLFTRDANNNIIPATRPTITSLSSSVGWGGAFTVSTPDAANISSVVLMRPGAPTHAFDMDQRLVVMSFVKGSGTLTVTVPPNGNIAPPGYYMVFLVNSSGVPSVARFIQVGTSTSAPAPTVSSVTPNTGTSNGGTGVTITGTGFLAGATVSLGGTAATGVTVVSSTSITATTAAHAAGTVNVVVTNTDAQSGTLANGYTYTGTNPAPTVTSITPNSGTINGGTAVAITGTGFLAGATVKLGGTAATGVTVVSSTSITATTPAHAAGAVSVVVTNTDAQTGTLTNGYTYTTTGGGGTITFVQVDAITPQTPSGSVILSYPLAQTVGNLNIVAVGWNDTTSTVSSVSDSRGNTYSQAGTTISGTGLRQAIYYAKNIAGGSNTVTVVFNQAAAYVDVRILEYSGLDTSSPLDVTAGAAGSSSSPNSGAATTSSSNELIFGAGMTAGTYSAAGTGFTLRIITTPDRDLAEDQLGSSAGSYSASAASTSSPWVMQMATFKASGQGGGNPAPTVTSITPNTGTTNGGTSVAITGTGFLAGATVKLGGTAATGVTVVSSTSITATTPAHAAGAVSVVVTNTDAQTGTLTNGYTYTTTNPAPTVTSITPNSGTINGGTAVTVTGTGFLAGATVKLGGTAATGVTVVSSTSITATTPAHAAGAVSVVVTNTDAQTGTLTNGYTYTTTNPAPTVTSITPNSGTINGGTAVTVTGTGFLAGATVKLGGTAATGVTVVSSTSITATTPAHAAGAVSVVVTNTDAQTGTLTNGYTYTTTGGGGTIAFVQVNAATPQTASASVPVTYPLAQTTGNLNIVAVGWNDTTSTVSSVSDSRGNTYSQAGTTISGTGLRQAIYYAKNIAGGSNTVTVVFNQAAAYVDVRILEYSGLDTSSPLDVTAGAAGSSSSPNSGAATTSSSNELIFGAGMTAGTYSAAGTGFTLRIITTPDRDLAEDQLGSSAGSYSASAASTSSPWVMQMATFKASGQGGGNPAPTVTSITPNTGTTNGGTSVAITGTGFLAGATVKLGGTAATGVTVVSSTSITATTPAHAAGAVSVVVTNTDAQTGTLTNGYTYTTTNPAPTVTSITPNSGTINGGTAVTVTGTGFLAGATVKLGGTAATGVTVVSSTSITATTPAHAAGAVSVVVTNTDAQTGTLTNGYTYTTTNPAPTVTSITPNSGTINGGTAVTVTGTGFLAGATVKLGGTAATGVTVVSSTSITATTPAHAAGAVSVVVTNTDAQTGTLTNGYTYTTTGGGGTIAFVQVNAATPQTASASVPVTYPLAQTTGNLNIVAVGWNDTTSTVSSVSDSRGNTYSQAGTTISGTGLRQAIYYAKNIAGGSNTVTVVFNQAAAYVDVRILEYSGLDTSSPLDVTAGAAGSSSSPNSGAATTSSSNELIFGAGMTAGTYSAAGTGFALRIITTPDRDLAEDQLGSSAGSYSASAASTSSPWVMQMATFKAQP